tara:strand:- start:1976 stop:2212 length:237 start_codon:yes stop_codon:yes gene_type:complete
MARRRKKKSQNITTNLYAKSTAQLDKSLEGFENIPDPKEPFVFNTEAWGAGKDSVPHIINGVPVEDEEKENNQDGNTE